MLDFRISWPRQNGASHVTELPGKRFNKNEKSGFRAEARTLSFSEGKVQSGHLGGAPMCRGLKFSLQESKEWRCQIFFEKVAPSRLTIEPKWFQQFWGGPGDSKWPKSTNYCLFPYEIDFSWSTRKLIFVLEKTVVGRFQQFLSFLVPPRIVKINWVL